MGMAEVARSFLGDRYDRLGKAQRRSLLEVMENVADRPYEAMDLGVADDADGAIMAILTVGLADCRGGLLDVVHKDTFAFFIGARGGVFQYEGKTRKYRKPWEVRAL